MISTNDLPILWYILFKAHTWAVATFLTFSGRLSYIFLIQKIADLSILKLQSIWF